MDIQTPAVMDQLAFTEIVSREPVLKVIGIGGGGSNAINRMIELGLTGVEYIAANTDAQALSSSGADVKVQLGPMLTKGLGAGGDPKVGESAARESKEEIKKLLEGTDMVFLAAGMGGGTGTGAIPVIAEIAKSVGTVTVGIVTTPFFFEIGKRQTNANDGLSKLMKYTDTLITIPNDRLLKIASKDLPLELAFRLADDVLRQGIQGISQLITNPGLINVDFSHIKRMMLNGGGAFLSIGYGEGENKAQQAIDQALNHPLLESIPLCDVSGIIVNFSGGDDLSFAEVSEALSTLQEQTNYQADLIPGLIYDPEMNGRVEVIMVMTGLAPTPVDESILPRATHRVEKPIETPLPEPVKEDKINQDFLGIDGTSNDYDVPAFLRRRMR